MAIPAALLAKAAVALASDKRTWKAVGVIIAAALVPLIIAIVALLGLASGAAHHNNAAVNLSFNGGVIPFTMPSEYRTYITEIRDCFTALDGAVTAIGRECEWEGELDVLRVKSVFYALYFGDDNLRLRASAARSFVDCFVRYETRTRPCTRSDHHDEDDDCEEEYIVAIPITDLPTVYSNVGSHIGRQLTPEDMANITEIYYRVLYNDFSVDSGNVSLSGGSNGTHAFIAELLAGDDLPPSASGYVSPIHGDWRSLVTCEFGTGYAGHTGMDIGIPRGTELRAVADGKVLFTRASSTGYGIHVAVNHGGGAVTLYAHCSRVLVGEGQTVTQGQAIALSGSTGNSTGPHLHLEFIIGGVPRNARNYLP